MLIQLIEGVALGISVIHGTKFIHNKVRKKKTVSDGTMKFAWYVSVSGTTWGFQCPKCRYYIGNKKQMPICSCAEYHKEHFHFKCSDCEYTNIMRTADDK